ncbi:hypothetical protein ACH0CG_01485 [Microbacterium sp. 179-I 1D1 NHS]|uniref:hypothetical protein n=1 Tax=Microbacterium sp. 179-I 1D1 NHS TaxID=3374298 RepID=UPI003879FB92
MGHHLSYDAAAALVFSRSTLLDGGWTSRMITHSVEKGRLIRIQRNRYVRAEDIADLWPESVHRVEIAAAVAEMRHGPGVVSYDSAAVLWDLPLYRHRPAAVHISMPGDARMSSRLRVRRHADRLADADLHEIGSVRCSSLERTVWDVARSLPADSALAAADAALRLAVDSERAGSFSHAGLRQRLLERCAASSGVRGIRSAIRIMELADPRAELPGESVTRLRLRQLGFRRIGIQVPVDGPDGQQFRVDLEIEDEGILLEFDGVAKYRDEGMRQGRGLEDVLLAEKQREDWIRGVTGKRLVRLTGEHIATPATLRSRLAAFGIRSPL